MGYFAWSLRCSAPDFLHLDFFLFDSPKENLPMSSSPAVAAPPTDAAEAAVEAISGAAGQEVSLWLALSQDQKDIRDWVHGFAADVVRPAAHEWDEREETPWPIIQEAAKIGLYGFEGMAQFFADP